MVAWHHLAIGHLGKGKNFCPPHLLGFHNLTFPRMQKIDVALEDGLCPLVEAHDGSLFKLVRIGSGFPAVLREFAECGQQNISLISRFSHKLENGYDTLIGERGIKLSGGERQRVGIARALIKDPAIIIFDEATSSLDAAVEAEIREAIREASKGRTTILIAHRFSTIRYANRIIVMDEGRVAGEGRHEDLYKSCEPYRKLVDHQVS